jgi:hypothetical protein
MSNNHTGNPLYPNLGPTIAKHRRLNDTSYDGQKAYGQAVHAAIRALQRRELMTAAYGAANLPRDVGAMSRSDFMAYLRRRANALRNIPGKVASEEDYYCALLEGRGVDVVKIIKLAVGEAKKQLGLWLKAAWNVIKGKRGTPYLVETPKAEPAPVTAPVASRPREALTRAVNKAIADGTPGYVNQPAASAPKKRGRPPGSKNRPKPVYSPGQQAAA